jgi:hypothetical protein
MHDPTNFYLACSGLLPVLTFADLFVKRVSVIVPTQTAADVFMKTVKWSAVGVPIWFALFGWAEFVCLRQLQTGHPPFGGAVIVWLDVALLFVQFFLSASVAALQRFIPEIFPSDGQQ